MMIVVIKGMEIINVSYPFPINNPTEGLQEDGNYVLYVSNDLDGLSASDFIEQRYWDGSSLQTRPVSPSRFCIWNGTEWQVDAPNYLKQVRFERMVLLAASDWTQLPDAPLTSEQLQEAQTYRQALRDITDPIIANPSAYIRIEDAPWPTPPSFLNAT